MARLLFSAIASVDGYVVDADGRFDWAAPDAEVHAYVNECERSAGTYLYGRRMYETMVAWETMDTGPGQTPVMRDYAEIWRAAEKVVFSRTLAEVSSARTRIERELRPAAIRRLKAEAAADITVGGPTLAADAFRAGLVDECSLFLVPVAVGGGTPALPRGLRVGLDLVAEQRFAGGVVHVRYSVRS